jgi:hypothetical protein
MWLVDETRCGYAAVLVDIVDSRHHGDRAALQEQVAEAAAVLNARIPSLDPMTSTVGDELQATYADLFVAIRAVSELRLELAGVVGIRAGIGWGDIVMHDAERSPFGQDGPAWWSARSALDSVAASTAWSGYEARFGVEFAAEAPAVASDAPPRETSTTRPPARPLALDAVAVVRSHLALLDRAFATIDATEARIVLGDLAEVPTEEIAAELSLSSSAVSQRRRRNHLRELVAALRVIDTAP